MIQKKFKNQTDRENSTQTVVADGLRRFSKGPMFINGDARHRPQFSMPAHSGPKDHIHHANGSIREIFFLGKKQVKETDFTQKKKRKCNNCSMKRSNSP